MLDKAQERARIQQERIKRDQQYAWCAWRELMCNALTLYLEDSVMLDEYQQLQHLLLQVKDGLVKEDI